MTAFPESGIVLNAGRSIVHTTLVMGSTVVGDILNVPVAVNCAWPLERFTGSILFGFTETATSKRPLLATTRNELHPASANAISRTFAARKQALERLIQRLRTSLQRRPVTILRLGIGPRAAALPEAKPHTANTDKTQSQGHDLPCVIY